MKTPFFSTLLAIFLTALPLVAQEGDGFGFLNVVNLIPGEIPADVTIAGKELVPGGLAPGSDTGWFMVPIGSKAMTIALDEPEDKKPRTDKASGEIDLIDGVANVVVIYLQSDSRVMPDGTPLPPKIRSRNFPAYDGSGFALKLISTCPLEGRFKIGSKMITAKPFEILEIPNWSGAPFEIFRDGKLIGKATGSSEQGSFYLFIGNNEAGEYLTVMTRSGTQTAPPWMKKTKEKETQQP